MLTSLQNPWIKQLRKLHRVKGRREAGLSLLEGTHLIEVACEVDAALVAAGLTPEWEGKHPKLAEELRSRCQRVELVSADLLQAIATTANPDGVIATLERDRQPHFSPQISRLGLVLDRVQDPGNLGTIIRTSAAAGIDGIIVSPNTVELDSPKVLRASAGAWFRVPIAVEPDLPKFIMRSRQQGCQIIATTATAARNYWQIDWKQPNLVLLGNEGAGLSEELLDIADEHASIPIASGVESLNVAIATALILYEAKRQNR
ncbi:TrmH family RNA methyltransferase [Roseofilum casamattae]|uniref:RNA methyltransferase n=1 Tax=Roseofilum casamattae BLCC-M143 TaxID=3022442 RepID=A0ABT7C1N7_9CYAN|nr:RNA methyltransferase [Roseofilum casamattae]MDJ1185335.1 RNA methyltransferase [Roseofilum casamattae BLCC-M143]